MRASPEWAIHMAPNSLYPDDAGDVETIVGGIFGSK
jgi:hypothetical protein